MGMKRFAAAALALLAAAGCASGAAPQATNENREPTAPKAIDTTGTPEGNRWWLRTDAQREDRSLDLWVHENACASGNRETGRIRPDVDYADDSITVTIRVEYAGGDQTCPGNPDTPYTLVLDEPIGDREIKDGKTTPPTRKGRPA